MRAAGRRQERRRSGRPAARAPAVAVLCGCAALVLGWACAGPVAEAEDLAVYAAASLRDLMTEIGADYGRRSGVETVFNFAGSNVLALQIEAARRADVFVSADRSWMDYVEERGLLEPGSRRSWLANRLVVIAHRESGIELRTLAGLATADFRFLSVADPEAVPAGRYARRLLSGVEMDGVDLWTRLEPRLAPSADVRAALAMVESRHDAVGIVYRTDARISSRVEVLIEARGPVAPPIRYSAAALRGAGPEALDFLAFLDGGRVAAIAGAHGFVRLPESG